MAKLSPPVDAVATLALGDGTVVHVRPIVPEDADLERAFVAALSDEARYFRFFYRLQELTPSMLARFTHVDYEHDMALAAVHDSPTGPAFVGVARYAANPDGASAEFAIVVADAWQGKGIGRGLVQQLIAQARRHGLGRLQGAVLRENTDMLRFVAALGFTIEEVPGQRDQVRAIMQIA